MADGTDESWQDPYRSPSPPPVDPGTSDTTPIAPPPAGSPPPTYQQPYQPPGYPPASYQQPGYPPPGYPPPGYPPPYYGPPPGYGGPYGYPPRSSGRATAVMILGIVAAASAFCWGFGFIAGIVGLCLAPGAKREIRESRGALTGEGMITAGIVCSIIGIAVAVAMIIFVVISIATSSPEWTTYEY